MTTLLIGVLCSRAFEQARKIKTTCLTRTPQRKETAERLKKDTDNYVRISLQGSLVDLQ